MVLDELETIDDDCDKHGIQFVKIDDKNAADEFGLDSLPTIVYFEKGLPNVYDGDLKREEVLLEWLVHQLEKDEIEDVTDEMLDKLIKDSKALAVLFCEYIIYNITNEVIVFPVCRKILISASKFKIYIISNSN